MKKLGFTYTGEFQTNPVNVGYIEYKGKDISFDRWRFSLYYEPNMAALHFEHSEQAANEFLSKHQRETHADYTEWSTTYEKNVI